jgi:hypothetical protein
MTNLLFLILSTDASNCFYTARRINLCKRNFAADSQMKNKSIEICESAALCTML